VSFYVDFSKLILGDASFLGKKVGALSPPRAVRPTTRLVTMLVQ